MPIFRTTKVFLNKKFVFDDIFVSLRPHAGISRENTGVRDIPHLNFNRLIKTMDELIRIAEAAMWEKKEYPAFKSGDTITVTYRIVEGNKERQQSFRGVVIQIKGRGVTKTFTIRKISNGVGVERIFPVNSPDIISIEVNKVGVVRRARIYYLRKLTGKKARIKEKRYNSAKKAE